jgi:plasmid stabilization system protein ParE
VTTYRILPAARAELREAVSWYQAQRAGTGRDLLVEVRRGFATIAEAPERCPRWHPSRPERKLALRRFPYLIIYEFVAGVVVVKAIAHMKRSAGYWSAR